MSALPGKARILVVDDESLWRECLCDMLAANGHRVCTASNGCTCLEVMEHSEVDMVLIDLFMPEKDGLSTIMDIRERFPGVRIIAMSGGTELLDAQRYLSVAGVLGADKVMQKPVPGELLLQAVSDMLPERI